MWSTCGEELCILLWIFSGYLMGLGVLTLLVLGSCCMCWVACELHACTLNPAYGSCGCSGGIGISFCAPVDAKQLSSLAMQLAGFSESCNPGASPCQMPYAQG